MWVSWRWHKHSRQIDQSPCLRCEVEVVKIIQLPSTIMTPKKVHSIVENSGRCSVPALRPNAISSDLWPSIRFEVKLVQIISIMTIVAPKHIHVIFKNHGWVWVSWAWTRLWILRLHQTPTVVLDAIAVEVVNSVIAIVPSKDIYWPVMDNCSVSIAGWWGLRASIGINLLPLIGRKVKAIEVVAAIGPVITTKDVEVVVNRDWGMERSWTRWMNFVWAWLFNHVPGVGLL